MAHGLPDFYSHVETILSKVTSIQHGLDADLSVAPSSGDAYVATDTKKVYICYVDGIWTDLLEALYDVSWSEPARAIDVIYQNTSEKIKVVSITVDIDKSLDEGIQIQVGAASPPVTVVARLRDDSAAAGGVHMSATFIVPVNYYYRAATDNATPFLDEWHEWDLF